MGLAPYHCMFKVKNLVYNLFQSSPFQIKYAFYILVRGNVQKIKILMWIFSILFYYSYYLEDLKILFKFFILGNFENIQILDDNYFGQ